MTKNNLKVVKTTKAQQVEGNEKNKALEAAMSQITDNFGKGSVMKLGQRRVDENSVVLAKNDGGDRCIASD